MPNPTGKRGAPPHIPTLSFWGENHQGVVQKELTDKRLRRGVFTNVPELIEAITTWGSHWNEDPSPFIWHASADEIIEKVRRGRAALNRQINSTTEH